ncbi:putative disease resistance RPP13-like protein 1 [Herrania umbratica]|uniref:Disease resistance RPP13-like protein 1 n=1 Tax=Herrania umbratica TaxID=108875 RepID=A0A6J1B8R8_9ROSI|nr:putative disease resistance RPP13-like protein 1 [Herrania umbratica]
MDVVVGGAFLSAFLQVLFDRMASREVIDFIRGKKLADDLLKKLKMLLLSVDTVLNDAEKKQITSLTVNKWVHELKDAVYDAEDVMDEIATEALKCRVEAKSKSSTSQVQQLISTSLGLFEKEIESKLEKIIDRLEYIAEQKDVLGLRTSVGRQSSIRLPTTSVVDESEVYGRDADKEEIMKLLLSDDLNSNGICVTAMVGMGGVGKTTLAQLVYNDEMVKEHFDLGAWICVSKELDICRVTNTFLEAFTSHASDSRDLNLLQVRLKESLFGKKFLLVLDDVWNENYIGWEVLQKPFRFGTRGSKIIVTTRNESVASIVQTVPTYHLKELLDEHCWLLFAKHAFGGQISSHASLELEVIGREIVRKCKGLPLAAKVLGCLLRSKTDAAEWNKILQSELWDLQINQNDILPALWLSYHYPPSHLKPCFAYFSLFPKDYEFEKEQLILLWMAEGFLPEPGTNQRLEEVGYEYFHDFVSRSLLQQSSTSDKSCYVMHDLVNDLAKFVAGEFCLRLEGYNTYKIEGTTRHLSYFRARCDPYTRFEAFNRARCLRTFLPLKLAPWYGHSLTSKVPLELLPKLKYLRVLSLSHYQNMSELPNSIVNLKHLRYLDLSCTAIRRLPEATCTLYNLQTIILAECSFLAELPANMGRLTNLLYS